MATLTAAPVVRKPSGKPSRAMTHPLRDPRAHGGKRKAKQAEPFDAEDLTRRLTAHLAEQKAKAEKRRAAREAKAAEEARLYHHVPKSAAAAFERTTTPDVMRSVPKMAETAIKAHLDALKIEEPAANQAPSLQRTKALDQAKKERELLRSRTQFKWNQDLEEANEMDLERDIFKVPQRTFDSEFAHSLGKNSSKSFLRPMSTGDICWDEDDLTLLSPKTKPKPLHDRNDRNDWVQRDDEENRKKEKANQLLRKKDSNWILLGMKSAKHDKGIENVVGSPPDHAKMKGGFLARFKRHPS